jgi:RNA polymerase sigma-70 factor (ECF subfamily)
VLIHLKGEVMSQQMSDDVLIAAVRQGDSTAFTQLVQRHWVWVCRLITAIVHDHAYAEDVAQEVFCQVYQHLDDYTPQGKFVAWLKRMTVNRARNFLRDHGRAIALGALVPQDRASTDRVCDPQMIMTSQLLQQEVRAALQTLPDEQRQVILRHYFGGQSVQAIAAALHCPIGTVKSRLFNGRSHMRRVLRALWTEGDIQHAERKEQR